MKATLRDFENWKADGQKFTCVTAYDAPGARILERAGVPMILVGDSLGNVVLGYEDTVPVTMDDMLHHARAVRRGAPKSFLVGDLPFLSYQVSVEEAVKNAGQFLKQGFVDAVKLEGGKTRLEAVHALVAAGIPVMGHLGLTPQSKTLLGGYRVQGADAAGAGQILDEALLLESAGVFSLVLECIPAELGAEISSRLQIPTVGIGAGPGCDAQVLVFHDLLGFEGPFHPRFVRRYAEVEKIMTDAVAAFKKDVMTGDFPTHDESFRMPSDEWEQFRQRHKSDSDEASPSKSKTRLKPQS